jgi:hypothetical protein
LTKDNLVKRNVYGDVKCYFCDSNETIHHLFFDCALAKFIWRVMHITFGLSIPNNIKHVFDGWIKKNE